MATVSKVYAAFFTLGGAPALGLSPTVTIHRADLPGLEVSAAAMTEIGSGWYAYTWTSHNTEREYVAMFDGGATLPDGERYGFAATTCDEGGGGTGVSFPARADLLVSVPAPRPITVNLEAPAKVVHVVTDGPLGAGVESRNLAVSVRSPRPPAITVNLKECP